MNAIDGTDHYEKVSTDIPPSLLTVIIDTNPSAWALLAPTLSFSSALAALQVFINAHLAFNYANKVAIIASHIQRAEFLYPLPHHQTPAAAQNGTGDQNGIHDEDQDMDDSNRDATSANQYPPFQKVSSGLHGSLTSLLRATSPTSLQQTPTTNIAGALTLALSYISKQTLLSSTSSLPGGTSATAPTTTAGSPPPTLQSRILFVSVSGDLASQYIPLMNCIFASQRLSIPLDILKLSGDSVFLQQACDATHGTFISPSSPKGILQYLMMAFLPDQSSRKHLHMPTQAGVDFRAACFCHRKVVDVGFVCSVCLSIFCEELVEGVCLTCGTALRREGFGGKPRVVVRKRKRKRDKGEGVGRGEKRARGESGTPAGTPGVS